MSKPRILIAYSRDDEQFVPEERERLRQHADLVENPHIRPLSDDEKLALLTDVDGVAVGRSGRGLTRGQLEAAPHLKVIGLLGSSVKMIDAEYALDSGRALFNTAPGLGLAVAEYALALTFCGLRDIHYFASRMETEQWPRPRRVYRNLTGKTVGLIGFGACGRHFARMLTGFDVRLLVFDPYVSLEVLAEYGAASTDLETLLRDSHIVSLHCAKTPETKHLLGEREFDLLQDGAVLVNTARGAVIDEDALARKLPERRFIACLNVYDEEPLPLDSPLRGHPNCVLTPHGGGRTYDTYRLNSQLLVDDFLRFFRGEPLANPVTRERLARMT